MQTLIEPTVKPLAAAIIRPPIRPIIHSFTGIVPIRTVDDGFDHGGFRGRNYFLTNQHVRLRELPSTLRAGTIALVCFNQEVGEYEYLALLQGLGYRPCLPNELLGLMAQVPEWRAPGEEGQIMPEELRDRDLVAAGWGYEFVFKNGCDEPCHICVDRHGTIRNLGFTPVAKPWYGNWAFGAKKIAR